MNTCIWLIDWCLMPTWVFHLYLWIQILLKSTVLFCYRYCSSASGSRNITFLGPFPKHYWSESLQILLKSYCSMSWILFFLSLQCIIARYFKIKIIGLRALHDIFHCWKSNIFKYNCSMLQLLYFWFKKCMVIRLFFQL